MTLLKILNGAMEGECLALEGAVLDFGREPFAADGSPNRLVFPHDDRISARHARFAQREDALGEWTVTDVGSSNGTTLEGRSLTIGLAERLVHGQILRMGRTCFLVWVTERDAKTLEAEAAIGAAGD